MALIKCTECGKEISDKAEACPHCGCPISAMTEPESLKAEPTNNGLANHKQKKSKRIKPWLFVVGVAVLLVVVLIAVSLSPDKYKWDEVLLKSALPEPSSEYGNLQTNTADDLYLIVKNVSFFDYETYVNECVDKGYTYVIESSASSYTAFNSDGYELKLDYYEYNESFNISLDIRITGTIKWSNSKLAALLPVPKSNVGSIVNDYTYGYEVYIGDTTKAEFDAYISECEAREFNLNVQKQDKAFYAENVQGYELIVEYYECDLIYINLDVPEDVADEEGLDEESDNTNSEQQKENKTDADNKETGNSSEQLAKSDEKESIENISQTEANSLLEKAIDRLDELVDDFGEALEYTDFTSVEDIQKYETMWEEMSKDAQKIKSMLAEKCPPSSCKEVWDEFSGCMGEISEIIAKGIDMDTNQDGQYSGEEMTELISAIRDEFVAAVNKACDLAKEYNNISGGMSIPDDGNSSNNSSSGNKCIECDKKATRTYTNPFSGKKENYCQAHYDEIIDMIGDMEQDVGNGSSSKHKCEECSREGTHSIIGFSGELEYYCTTHYNELKEMFEIFG